LQKLSTVYFYCSHGLSSYALDLWTSLCDHILVVKYKNRILYSRSLDSMRPELLSLGRSIWVMFGDQVGVETEPREKHLHRSLWCSALHEIMTALATAAHEGAAHLDVSRSTSCWFSVSIICREHGRCRDRIDLFIQSREETSFSPPPRGPDQDICSPPLRTPNGLAMANRFARACRTIRRRCHDSDASTTCAGLSSA